MNTIGEILSALEEHSPVALQESYDNSGLLVGSAHKPVERVLLALDCTEAVVDEAISKKCDLILCHHPLIFSGIKQLTGKTFVERAVIKLIQNDIALIAAHTNLDNSQFGISKILADKIGIENPKVLQPLRDQLCKLVTFCPSDYAEKVRSAIFSAGAGFIGNYDECSFNLEGEGSFRAREGANPFVGAVGQRHYEKEIRIETIFPAYLEKKIVQSMIEAHPYEEVAYDVYPLKNQWNSAGSGMIGMLSEEMSTTTFLNHIKTVLGCSVLRYSDVPIENIRKVAVCGGAGAFLLPVAKAAGADAFVSSEFKYNQYFETDNSIMIVDAGHFETEQFATEIFFVILTKKFPNFAVLFSEYSKNPIKTI